MYCYLGKETMDKINMNKDCVLKEARLLLSILIPAYNYPEGVHKIINQLMSLSLNQYEILVFDNSSDNRVKHVVEKNNKIGANQIKYHKNDQEIGAVPNWNALLDAAKGDFCLLMHHDEFPLGVDFVQRLLDTLVANPRTDVFMMDCILISPTGNKARRHVPTWMRQQIVHCFPNYLFRRNVVGPISVLVVRRSLFPRFDKCLLWLVDVELYVRLRTITNRWRICPELQVGSLLGRSDSITASISSNIDRLHIQELAYLDSKYPSAAMWVRSGTGNYFRALEATVWFAFRVVTRGFDALLRVLGISPIAPKNSQRTSK